MKILIVDDSDELTLLFSSILERSGHEVCCVKNIEQAKQQESADLALIDWNLEDGSGLDLVEELSKRDQMQRLILISANRPNANEMNRLNQAGASFELKPITPMRLIQIAKA